MELRLPCMELQAEKNALERNKDLIGIDVEMEDYKEHILFVKIKEKSENY